MQARQLRVDSPRGGPGDGPVAAVVACSSGLSPRLLSGRDEQAHMKHDHQPATKLLARLSKNERKQLDRAVAYLADRGKRNKLTTVRGWRSTNPASRIRRSDRHPRASLDSSQPPVRMQAPFCKRQLRRWSVAFGEACLFGIDYRDHCRRSSGCEFNHSSGSKTETSCALALAISMSTSRT